MLVRDPVMLRSPEARDYDQWLALRTQSRPHLTKWEDDWAAKDVTPAAYRRRLRLWERQRRQAAALSLFIVRTDDGALAGGVTLSNIRFGASRSAVLGYWVGAPYARRGYGRIAVDETVSHAFRGLGLHRVEAACQPENEPSARLLKKLGFQREGRARGYLRINGSWRDHDIYALTADDRR